MKEIYIPTVALDNVKQTHGTESSADGEVVVKNLNPFNSEKQIVPKFFLTFDLFRKVLQPYFDSGTGFDINGISGSLVTIRFKAKANTLWTNIIALGVVSGDFTATVSPFSFDTATSTEILWLKYEIYANTFILAYDTEYDLEIIYDGITLSTTTFTTEISIEPDIDMYGDDSIETIWFLDSNSLYMKFTSDMDTKGLHDSLGNLLIKIENGEDYIDYTEKGGSVIVGSHRVIPLFLPEIEKVVIWGYENEVVIIFKEEVTHKAKYKVTLLTGLKNKYLVARATDKEYTVVWDSYVYKDTDELDYYNNMPIEMVRMYNRLEDSDPDKFELMKFSKVLEDINNLMYYRTFQTYNLFNVMEMDEQSLEDFLSTIDFILTDLEYYSLFQKRRIVQNAIWAYKNKGSNIEPTKDIGSGIEYTIRVILGKEIDLLTASEVSSLILDETGVTVDETTGDITDIIEYGGVIGAGEGIYDSAGGFFESVDTTMILSDGDYENISSVYIKILDEAFTDKDLKLIYEIVKQLLPYNKKVKGFMWELDSMVGTIVSDSDGDITVAISGGDELLIL